MCFSIKPFVVERLRKKQLIAPDDLLEHVNELIGNESFNTFAVESFSVVIVDEFQDTDPLQWRIFSELFLSLGVCVQLVGDPKQAIYAFRKADVYSYIQAKEAFEEKQIKVLSTNYRASVEMVEGLNSLFYTSYAKDVFYLPKKEEHIDFPKVLASKDAERVDFQDEKTAILSTISLSN